MKRRGYSGGANKAPAASPAPLAATTTAERMAYTNILLPGNRRRRRRLQGASRVPPRGGSAEARHFPTPVRCSGGAGGPGSAAPGLTSLPPAAGTAHARLHGRHDQSRAPIGTEITPAHVACPRACFLVIRAAPRASIAQQPRPRALRAQTTAAAADILHRRLREYYKINNG